MASLPNSWRSLLSQQAVTTGRGITPQQAAALRQGELEANYNISGSAQDRALSAKYQADQMALAKENQSIQASQFDKSLAARQAEWEASMGMQEESLGLQGKTAEEQAQIAKDSLQAQKDQNAEANRIQQQAIDKQSSAATTSGYVQMASALPMAYMVAKNLFGKKDATQPIQTQPAQTQPVQAVNQPYQPDVYAAYPDMYTSPGYEYYPASDLYDTGSWAWNTPSYDWGAGGAYDFGGYGADIGAGAAYDFGGETFDWGSMLFDFM